MQTRAVTAILLLALFAPVDLHGQAPAPAVGDQAPTAGGLAPTVGDQAGGVQLEAALALYRSAEATQGRDARLARFGSAERMLSILAEKREEPSAALWTNAGSAALQAEHLGPAVLAFRRALAIDPDHREAKQNLDHARTLLAAWVPRPSSGTALDAFFFWHRTLSAGERLLYASLFFAVATLLIAASIRWRQSTLRNLAILPLIAWGALLASVFLDDGGTSIAVVTIDEVVVHSADSPYAQSRFANPLPGGAEVTVTSSRDEWTQIQLADGRDGWVPTDSLTPVNSR